MSETPPIPDSDSVSVDLLQVGMFIQLPLSWLDHPFAFNSFKISTLAQLKEVRALGLTTVKWDPAKSQSKPLPCPAPPSLSLIEAPDPTESIAQDLKKQRILALAVQREAIAACERSLLKAGTTLKSINQKIFSRPQESMQEANTLVAQFVESMLTNRDAALHLMNDKIAGEDTYFHALNVTVLSMILAKEMKLGKDWISVVGFGALFHDIGKQKVPDSILKKTEPRNRMEEEYFRQHTAYGLEIGERMGLPKTALQIISQHHEHIDGSGYPNKLMDDQIFKLARLVAIVDKYDSLCNQVNPAKSLTPYEALSTLFAKNRGAYDATVLATFIRMMGVYPPGSLVQLSNEAIGLVVSVVPDRPTKPSVLIYDPEIPKKEAIIVDMAQEPDLSIIKSIRISQLPREIYEYLSPRTRVVYHFDDGEKPGRKD